MKAGRNRGAINTTRLLRLFRRNPRSARKLFAPLIAVSLLTLAYLIPSPVVFAVANPPSVLSPVFSYQNATPIIDGASGALTEHIAIDIPPGRNQLQPALSLDYNSQNTANDSIVGYGWSLSIPYVERLNNTG
jgi:hypothetical protein